MNAITKARKHESTKQAQPRFRFAFSSFRAFVILSCLTCSAQGKQVSVCDYGATPNGGGDDSKAFQMAGNACQRGDLIFVAAGEYRLSRPIDWTFTYRVDVEIEDTTLAWRPADPTYRAAITWGGKPGVRMDYARWKGGQLYKQGADQWKTAEAGLAIQNLGHAHVDFEIVKGFRTGLLLRGDGAPVAYSTIHGSIAGCKVGITVEHVNEGWTNCVTFEGGHLAPPALTGIPPYDESTLILVPRGLKRPPQGWVFRDWRFEGRSSPVKLLEAWDISHWSFEGMVWTEVGGGVPRMTCAGSAKYPGTVFVRGGMQSGVAWSTAPWITREP